MQPILINVKNMLFAWTGGVCVSAKLCLMAPLYFLCVKEEKNIKRFKKLHNISFLFIFILLISSLISRSIMYASIMYLLQNYISQIKRIST